MNEFIKEATSESGFEMPLATGAEASTEREAPRVLCRPGGAPEGLGDSA